RSATHHAVPMFGSMPGEAEVAAAKAVVADLGLRSLGYEVDYTYEPPRSLIVNIRHPLLSVSWGSGADTSKDGWPETLRRMLGAWPDIDLVRSSTCLRPEAVQIVTALRHGAMMARSLKPQSDARTDGALRASTLAALTMRGSG